MLLHEYEDLMGNHCEENIFNEKINPLYMMTNLDKADFCDDYKLHGHSRIMEEVLEHTLKVERQLNAANKALADLQQKMTVVAEHLVFVADDCGSEESYKHAVDLVGQRDVTKFKVENDIDLNEQDKQYIINNLT